MRTQARAKARSILAAQLHVLQACGINIFARPVQLKLLTIDTLSLPVRVPVVQNDYRTTNQAVLGAVTETQKHRMHEILHKVIVIAPTAFHIQFCLQEETDHNSFA
jgi:hypothetical protein